MENNKPKHTKPAISCFKVLNFLLVQSTASYTENVGRKQVSQISNKIREYPHEYFLLLLSCIYSQSVVSLHTRFLSAFGQSSCARVPCAPSSASKQFDSLSQGWAFKPSILLQKFSALTKSGE